MLDSETAPDAPPTQARLPPLFRHGKREQWGLSMVIQRLDDRVHMQFQDGRRRTFLNRFFDLLEPVDRPYDEALGVVEALRSMFVEEGTSFKVRDAVQKPISVAEQAAYFREVYESGFQSEAYAEQHRSDGRSRPLKRHRDGAVTAAAELLSPEAFDAEPTVVHAAMAKLIGMTDLVAAKERTSFAAIEEQHHEPLANTLKELLHGKGHLVGRFDAFIAALTSALGESPSWGLGTAFAGLVSPNEHVVVRPSTFQRQAIFMAPGLRCSERPMGLLYERLLGMAQKTRARMEDSGLKPRDYLDVRDFMWMTLKPAGRRRIQEMRAQHRLDEPSPTPDNRAA